MKETIRREENTERVRQTKTQLFWEIFRFLLVGGTATAVDYIVFYLFRQWILPSSLFAASWWNVCSLVLATAFGFIVGLIVNWLLSVSFVFRSVRNKAEAASKKSFFVFAIIGLIGLGITEIGVVALVHIFPEITLFGRTEFLLPWKEWLAKAIMTCIVLVFNYVGRKLLIFKS